jgi:hypothetical protein
MLSTVPAIRRRRAAWVLAAMAALLLAAGVLVTVRDAPVAVHVVGVIALLVGVLNAAMSWGFATSVTLDARAAAEARLDAVLLEAGGGSCACGTDHDTKPGTNHGADPHNNPPAEPVCVPDSRDCSHSCASCVLAQHTNRPIERLSP